MPPAPPTAPAGPPRESPERAELDRRIYHLQTLLEASRELEGLTQPGRIMEHTLLAAMGALGSTHGLALLVHATTFQATGVQRGLGAEPAAALQGRWSELGRALLTPRVLETLAPQARRLAPVPGGDWPAAAAVMGVRVDDTYAGLLLVGPRHDGRPPDAPDEAFLEAMGNTLGAALRQALAAQAIERLNADLQRRNAELQEALNGQTRTRRALDRRVYHLQSLTGLTAALIPENDLQAVIDAFLLTAMGAVGAAQGCVLLLDRARRRVLQATRGWPPAWPGEAAAAEALLYKGLQATAARLVPPMQAAEILDPRAFGAGLGLASDMQGAWVINVDDVLWGLVALGAPMHPEPLTAEERELLQGFVASLQVFLRRTQTFEAVQALNADLARGNAELRQTIAELTAARREIRLLESARYRLRRLALREMVRVAVFRWRDACVMLAMALALALVFNLSNPNGIPLVPEVLRRPAPETIDVVSARQLRDQGRAVIIDARPPELYMRRHVAEALNVPAVLFDMLYPMKVEGLLAPGDVVIVYGRTISRPYDREVAYRVAQRHAQVRTLAGGIAAWEQQGYPVAP